MSTRLFSKYHVTHRDGTPTDPSALYFVLRLDTDEAARAAALTYASSVAPANLGLASDIVLTIAQLSSGLVPPAPSVSAQPPAPRLTGEIPQSTPPASIASTPSTSSTASTGCAAFDLGDRQLDTAVAFVMGWRVLGKNWAGEPAEWLDHAGRRQFAIPSFSSDPRAFHILTDWLTAHGTALSLDWDSDAEMWECSWIVVGARLTAVDISLYRAVCGAAVKDYAWKL